MSTNIVGVPLIEPGQYTSPAEVAATVADAVVAALTQHTSGDVHAIYISDAELTAALGDGTTDPSSLYQQIANS